VRLRRPALAAAALAVAAACASAAGERSAAASDASGREPYLYVTNQNGASVSVISVADLAVVDRVDLRALGFGENAKPHDTAVEPDGSYWYVTLIGENRVLKFDRGNRLVGQAAMEVPGLVVVHPTDDLLLVGRSMTAVNPPSSIAFIRRSDMTLLDEVEVVFPRPHALAVHPSGRWAYTASLAENRAAAIEIESGAVALFDLPAPPVSADATPAEHAGHAPHTLVEFAIAPDGRTMVGSGEVSGELLVFDLGEPAAPRVVESAALGGAPWHPAFTPDGRWVYVPLHRANAVAVIDAGTWRVAARIESRGIAQPHGAAPSPDGRFVFVSNNNTGGEYVPSGPEPNAGTVVAIDVGAREIVAVLEVGPNATGLDTVPPRRAPAR
jgi:YVTN family beta-propeller protein